MLVVDSLVWGLVYGYFLDYFCEFCVDGMISFDGLLMVEDF